MGLSRRNKALVLDRNRGTTSGGVTRASQRPHSHVAGKGKSNALASSSDGSEPANSCPIPGAGSAPMPATSAVTGEIAAVDRLQLVSSQRGVRYAALLAGPVAPFQASGSLKPTATGSDLSGQASSKTAYRCMYSDMSGPAIDKQDCTTQYAHVTNTSLVTEELPYKTPIFLSGVSDARTFLAVCGHVNLPV